MSQDPFLVPLGWDSKEEAVINEEDDEATWSKIYDEYEERSEEDF